MGNLVDVETEKLYIYIYIVQLYLDFRTMYISGICSHFEL